MLSPEVPRISWKRACFYVLQRALPQHRIGIPLVQSKMTTLAPDS